MYYKTLRQSETGIKFQKIESRMKECTDAISLLSDKYGFKRWRHSCFYAWGGISAVLFNMNDNELQQNPNPSFWKEVPGGYLPKRNTKEGKKACEEFDNLPKIESHEINSVVGYKPDFKFNHIGFSFNNILYYLFSTDNNTPFECPYDCVEITFSEYKELSKNE